MVDRVSEQAVWWSVDGRGEKARVLIVAAIEISRQELGAVQPDTLTLVRGVVPALGSKPGYWEFVETLLLEYLKECILQLGSDHPETLQMLEAMAYAAKLKGDYCSAELILAETLLKRERALAEERDAEAAGHWDKVELDPREFKNVV
jgi:hypothetical protein